MNEQDWAKALQHLQRAIEIYPQYAMVYNNLGAVYGHLNDRQHEREAFQKAIDLDSLFAPGYVNLAKLCLQEQELKAPRIYWKRPTGLNGITQKP
jgi:tetratricopeptide (TPR) repeat protein